MKLAEFLNRYNYQLVIDPHPQGRADAVGNTDQDRGPFSAQLCRNKTVAVTEDCPEAVYNVTHELAHGRTAGDEKDVLLEQATLLSRYVQLLLVRGEHYQ